MSKNINKLIAFAIGISVMSGSIIPAFAADAAQQAANTTTTNVQIVNGKTLLTLDEAIKAAISSSDKLTLDDQKITYQDKINDTSEKQDDNNKADSDQEDFNKDTRGNKLNQLKQQKDFDEDTIIQQVTSAYNDIVTRQLKLDKTAKVLEVQNKLLNDAKLKNSLGLMTTTDLTSTQLKIESLQNQQKADLNALNDAEHSFKVTTGKDVNGYSLEQDIKYDTFKIDGSVDDYLDNVIESYLKYKIESIQLNKDYYNDKDNIFSGSFTIDDLTDSNKMKTYKDNADPSKKPPKSDDTDTDLKKYEDYLENMNTYNKDVSTYAGALAARIAYLQTKSGMYEGETDLNENKKQLKESLRTLYSGILAAQDNISYIKKNIELTNKQLSDAKLKYDLGLMIKSDYDTLVVNSKDLEIKLRTTIDSYNTLKTKLQKPWLLASGSSSGNTDTSSSRDTAGSTGA